MELDNRPAWLSRAMNKNTPNGPNYSNSYDERHLTNIYFKELSLLKGLQIY